MLNEVEQKIAEYFIKKISEGNISKENRIFICPVGVTASGKTTLVKPLAEILKIPIISNDEIRKVMGENNLRYDDVHLIFGNVAKHFLDLGFGLVYDADCINRVEYIKKISSEYNLKIFWIHVVAPENFIINKLKNYSGQKYLTEDQGKMIENYFIRKKRHEELLPKLNLLFDFTCDMSQTVDAKKLAKEIRGRI